MFKKLLLLTTILLVLIQLSQAETYYHKDHLFNLGLGARPLAMGKSFSAVNNDVNVLLFNPAGMATIEDFQIMGLKSQRMIDVNQYTFLSGYKINKINSVIGLGYIDLSLQNILLADPSLDSNGYPIIGGHASYSERVYIINFAKKIRENHALGINYKIYHNNLDNDNTDLFERYNAEGNSIDLGYQYLANKYLQFGVSYQNIIGNLTWSTEAEEKIEGKINIGTALKSSFMGNDLLLTVDHGIAENDPPLTHAGLEVSLQQHFSLRYGLNQRVWKDTTKFSQTIGAGLQYMGLNFDYTYYPDFGENIDPKHFFSITYQFTAFEKAIAQPPVTKPAGQPEQPAFIEDDYEDIEYIYMKRNN